MKVLSKIVQILTVILTVTVIIFALILIIPRVIGYTPYTVLSGSMEPVIPTGSVAFIDKSDKTPEVNKIVTFTVGDDTIVTHRIISYDPDTQCYITKGDANNASDMGELDPSGIIGSYKFNIPYLGYIVSAVSGKTLTIGTAHVPSGAIFIIFLVIGMNVLSSILSLADQDDDRLSYIKKH